MNVSEKRSFDDNVNPIKQEIAEDGVSKIARIAISAESDWGDLNCVGMPSQDLANCQAKWIRLADHIYPIQGVDSIPPGTLLLSLRQVDEVAKGIFMFNQNRSILANPVMKAFADFPLATKAHFSLTLLENNEEGQVSLPLHEIKQAFI